MKNMEIRELIEKRRLKFYEVADAMNVHPVTFSRWLQLEMKPEKKAEVIKAIEGIKV